VHMANVLYIHIQNRMIKPFAIVLSEGGGG
jgi:hypothetical protein